MAEFYTTGTVSVTSGGTVVTGVGTFWTPYVLAADTLELAGQRVTVASVGGNTSLTLSAPWTGADQSGASYTIRFDAPSRFTSAYLATQVRSLIDKTAVIEAAAPVYRVQSVNGNTPPGSPVTNDMYVVGTTPTAAWAGRASNLAQWTGSAWQFTTPLGGWWAYAEGEGLFVFDGAVWSPGELGVRPRGAWAIGTTYNVGDYVTYSDLTFVSLVNSNVGNTPPSDESDTDYWMWMPAGPQGVAGTATAGDTTTASYGTPASVTNVGTSSAAVFDFVIPEGPQGAPGLGSGGYGLPLGGTDGQALLKDGSPNGASVWGDVVKSLVAGDGISINDTNPFAPIVTSNHRVINVRDYGVKGDGTDETLAILNVLAARAGSTLDATLPDILERPLYFPAGRYYAPGLTITTTGTGQVIMGDGRASVLDGIGIVINDRNCSAHGFSFIGDGDFGIKFQRAARRFSLVYDIYGRGRDIGIHIENGSIDNFCNTILEQNGVNLRVDATLGLHWTNGEFWTATEEDNIQLNFTESSGEVKFVNCRGMNAARFGLYMTGSTSAIVENYFVNCTFTQQQLTRTYTITSVANSATPGQIVITTSADHQLIAGLSVTISGTTDYDGQAYIKSVGATNTFEIAKTYTSTKTGQVIMPNWGVVIDGGSNYAGVNDIWFIGGNINHIRIIKAFNIQFWGTRLKEEVWIDDANRVMFNRGRRGRGENSFADIPVSGPGAIRGWGEFAQSEDATAEPGALAMEVAVPNTAAGLTGNVPSLNRLRVTESSVQVQIAGTISANFLPDQVLLYANGHVSARYRASASAVNYIDALSAPTGQGPQIGVAGSDTNADLRLTGKGTGVVRFGTWTSNADAAVNGYITIKDYAGTTRKLATIA